MKLIITIIAIAISNISYANDKNDIYNYDSVQKSQGTYISKRDIVSNPVYIPPQNIQSIPIKISYSCEAFRGQYDIDSKATGTFYLIKENNQLLSNYNYIIGSDNSNCSQACSPKTTTDIQSCSSINGEGWTGNYTTLTPFNCSKGGYLQEGTKTSSNNCLAPVVVTPPQDKPNKTTCKYIKPMSSGSLYLCTNTDGTSYYTEEPPIDEPEPICPMVSGFEAKQGSIEKACDIWGSAGVYPAGQNYLCTYDGWKLNNKGNSQYLNYCE